MTPCDPVLVLIGHARELLLAFERSCQLIAVACGAPVRPDPRIIQLFEGLTALADVAREVGNPADDDDDREGAA